MLLVALFIPGMTSAGEIKPFPEMSPEAKALLDKYPDPEDDEKDEGGGRGRGRPNMCQFDCQKQSLACVQRCNVEKVDPEDEKVTDKKKVVSRKQSEGEKCAMKCGQTQNKCMSGCKK